MISKVSCIAVDLINADKPPASLAFLAGACERAQKEYQALSLNFLFLKHLTTQEYNSLYADLKLNNISKFNGKTKIAIDFLINQIINFKTDLIMISVFSYLQYSIAKMFLIELKAAIPNTTVIVGGPGINHSSNGITNGRRLLEENLIDYYCLGEGDEVIIDFLNDRRDVLGINSKRYPIESWVPQIDNLEEKYLLPSYKKIQVEKYKNIENKTAPIYSLSTSRGCVRSCSFCDVKKSWNKFRFRSGKSVAEEILQHYKDVGAIHFTIVDSLINGSLKSFKDFNIEMIKLKYEYPGLENFSYNGMFIVRDRKTHTEELFKSMKDAGCESLAIGVETGSDRLRFEMNKKFTNDDLDYHLEMCQKYGIRNTFLMFVGYPTETKEDFKLTLDMLKRYQKYLIDDTIIGINHAGIFSLEEGQPIYDNKDEIGIEITEHIDNGRLSWVNINNLELTLKERIKRDLEFRETAIRLRYPIPYTYRYLEYLKTIDSSFIPVAD